MPRSSSRAVWFWPVIIVLVLLDIVTKDWAEAALQPRGVPHDVFGETVRLTLVYNPGAAFGIHLGPWSRWIFLALTVGALFILARLYFHTRPGERARALALGLVTAGAIGNLIDRITSPIGVVDFIDVGVGDWRWPTFNVADMAVSVGAIVLAWVLWGDDKRVTEEAPAGPARALSQAPERR
ncbi:MAG TPA: signal peptidase II [Gemmatimonadaceae bacterium]|nr:signal peptidase II [Gemmatimonadaceae bacterium]